MIIKGATVLKKQFTVLQIISVAIVLLFITLSAFDSIFIYKESTGYTQEAVDTTQSNNEPAVYTYSYNNQLLRVAVIGVVEMVLIITGCFKLGIVASTVSLFLTAGTVCKGYLEQLFVSSAGFGLPMYTVTFEITLIGYSVAALAFVNVAMMVMLQLKRKKLVEKQETVGLFDENAAEDRDEVAQ